MNMYRELLRAELKSTAYHRRMVKARARTLFQTAQKMIDSQETKHWGNTTYAAASLRVDRASYARSLNVANGLIRGMAYRKIEASCKEAPDAEEVLSIIKSHVGYSERKDWTLERVKELLN